MKTLDIADNNGRIYNCTWEVIMLERTIRVNYLLDFYKILLTKKQRFALEMYFQEDLSLVEIGENLGVSRQAIYDLLKRGETLLEEYENKLNLYDKYISKKNKAEEVIEYIKKTHENDIDKEILISKIWELVE